MANPDTPNGFQIVGTLSGAPWNGVTRRCYKDPDDAVALFPGDMVKLVAGNEGASAKGALTVAACTAGAIPCGIVVSVEFNPDALEKRYSPASTEQFINVCMDPNVLMEAQASGDAAVDDGDIGGKAELLAGAGNTTTGASGHEIDTGSGQAIAATNTFHLSIISLSPKEGNALGLNAKLLCSFNIHEYLGGGTPGSTGVHA